ncbi:CotY/CotZ family spore coat protein [Siminovitchia sediminis]|uniref:CotY/CotZ family spore coat protein n=1 Tax=Siminovitchia sediminis TaxID=1274353 RepID=A0ABW4KE95_9BACI
MGFEEMESSFDHTGGQSSHKGHGGCGCSLNCVCQVVKAIKDIQDQAEDECEPCTSSCFVEPLGDLGVRGKKHADTRVFTLTFKNGEFLKGLYKGHQGKCVSIYFRVEEIFDNCCATLRVLVPLKSDGRTVVNIIDANGNIDYAQLCEVKDWGRSNSCITVDLHCFCAVQCIADVDLQLCD